VDADDADLDEIGNLSVRQRTFETRIARLAAGKLFDAQAHLQEQLPAATSKSRLSWVAGANASATP
jgi:hypothetical protein